MSSEALFSNAIRRKFRFQSVRGSLNCEQIWDLPLRSKDGFDLDQVARAINSDLKDTGDSFVPVQANPAREELGLKLDLIKHVIAVKLAEESEALLRAAKRDERRKLEHILATKQAQQLESLSVEEIEKRLAALGATV